jgi:hypothetical protein
MERPTCKTCPYWSEEEQEEGLCRRAAPSPIHIGMYSDRIDAFPEHIKPFEQCWPSTYAFDFCGEHPDFPAFLAATRPPASPASQAPDPAPRTAE